VERGRHWGGPLSPGRSPADWLYWETFLREHPEVVYVAGEFQTGLARPERGREAIEKVAEIQLRLGRPLHVVAVGASRFRSVLEENFDTWTVLDSVPFMKAVKRRAAARVDLRRVRWERAVGEDVADLLLHNVGRYTQWMAAYKRAV
jgi:hypothetical protein